MIRPHQPGEALGVATPANRLLHAIVKRASSRFIAPAQNRRLKLELSHE